MRSNFTRNNLGGLGALALLFAFPVLAAAQAKEIVIWHGYRGGEKAAFEQVIEEFNKANAGKVHASSLAVPYDAFADKISAAVPRGKGPDVFIFAQDRLGGWVAAGNRRLEPGDLDISPSKPMTRATAPASK